MSISYDFFLDNSFSRHSMKEFKEASSGGKYYSRYLSVPWKQMGENQWKVLQMYNHCKLYVCSLFTQEALQTKHISTWQREKLLYWEVLLHLLFRVLDFLAPKEVRCSSVDIVFNTILNTVVLSDHRVRVFEPWYFPKTEITWKIKISTI